MKLKLDDKGNVVLKDGKPVYVADDGTEHAFDAPSMHSKIAALNTENKTFREGKEAAEKKLDGFKGIEDPAAALKALETVANLDAKKLIDAGEVEKVKREAQAAVEQKLAEVNKTHATEVTKLKDENASLTNTYHAEKISSAFNGSTYVAEKLAIPADLVQAQFGKHFKVEDGKIVGYDGSNNKLFSRSKAGENAEFEEAIEILVEAYAHKDKIKMGSGESGTGKKGAGGGGRIIVNKGNLGGNREDRVAAIGSMFPDLK